MSLIAIIESEITPSPPKAVVMFDQSLAILKVLIEASFEGADKSVLKYKNIRIIYQFDTELI